MRTVLALCLMLGASLRAAEPDLRPALAASDLNERYRLALAALRTAENPARHAGHADARVAEAAIDAARERIAEIEGEPTREAERVADELLIFAERTDKVALAARAVHAVAESHNAFGGRISGTMARLAVDSTCAVRLDAITALSELRDGSQAATLARLAGDANDAVAEAARESLANIQGKGVTDAFLRGIGDTSLGTQARIALLQAATKRGLTAATPAAAKALAEPALRNEAQKALLKLARKTHLAELQAARAALVDAPSTQAALDRLIDRLSKE
ncbi:MAG: hypothetical protein ACO23N_04765 [Opitutales bacterium]